MRSINELHNWELDYALLMKKLDVDNIDYLYDIKTIKDEIKKRNISDINIYNYELLRELLLKMKKRFFEVENLFEIYELDNRDPYFYKNIGTVSKMMEEYYHKIGPSWEVANKKRLDKKEITGLVRELLWRFDETGEWEQIARDLIYSDKLVYVKELTDEEKKNLMHGLCLSRLDCSGLIYNTDTGEVYNLFYNNELVIDAVPELVHELIHYISIVSGNRHPRRLIKEFPSIFYEKYAISLLKHMGYTDIDYLYHVRNNEMISSYNDVYDILYYLKLDKDNRFTQDKMLKDNLRTIKKMIKYPYLLNYTYPYLIGSKLADNANMMVWGDKLVLQIVKYITEHLETVSEEPVIDIFNYENGYTKVRK